MCKLGISEPKLAPELLLKKCGSLCGTAAEDLDPKIREGDFVDENQAHSILTDSPWGYTEIFVVQPSVTLRFSSK